MSILQTLEEYDTDLGGILRPPVLNKIDRGVVSHADCIKVMESIPDESVQCVFADPPFNLNKKYNSYKDNMLENDYFLWTEEWISEAFRVLAADGSLFVYNIPKRLTKTANICDKYGFFRHWISWQSLGKPLGKSLLPTHYGILYYTKQERGFKFYNVRTPHKKCRKCNQYLKDYGGKQHLRHKFGYLVGDVWDDIHRVRHSQKRIENHPCQLPPHLIERLLLMATDPGDLCLDLFAGGGSAGVAAKQVGRDYIGCELDEKYVILANNKISDANPQIAGSAYVSNHLGKIISIRDCDINQVIG